MAEDNLINQQVTRNVLEQHGHQVTLVDNGEAALKTLQSDSFDLAIVDMMMPGLGGLDVIRQYKRQKQGQPQPFFVVLTANTSEEARASCKELEVGYLAKPIRGQTLQASVQAILNSRRDEAVFTAGSS